ncbi:M20/M25/M40 family metallo-hydrolase [Indioceanicola profundi]|uniref:M20/M25/M40 family metallo-hydrolase n=1 Tax=Indioceanicola profundi TaxID=2220096 RepID=UPI000E6AC169|nr:M20/M25/M40 family metallo-hydrolase [Indioceanicola profundi]
MSHLDQVLAKIDADLEVSLNRLFRWLEVPSISTDPAYKDHCRAAGQWLAEELKNIGIDASLRETGGHPAVVAHAKGEGKLRALFYGHYDVQPVDPLDLWDRAPFEPSIITLPDGRKAISARGAADDKGQVLTFVEACRAWKAVTGSLPINITFLVEGAEEDGSKFLPEFIEANKDELKADVALVCDTNMWNQDTPQITSSLRGMVYEEVIVRCADRDLHSGQFGGAARNPIHVLSKIIAAIHDESGRITIKGFYDGVPETPPEVLEQWRGLGLGEAEFLGPIGLKHSAGETDRMLIEQVQSRPTCDVNGIIGGYTGEGTKTVIAAEARCKISFRLVGDQDPEKISANFQAFVRERIPADCSVEFIKHKGSRALALPHDFPALVAARSALRDEWDKDPIVIGSGGSIPVGGDFKRILGLDTLFAGFGLDDDRIHSPNEKYDLKSFHKGTRSWARILAALAE